MAQIKHLGEISSAHESAQEPILQVATVFEDATAARCAQRLIDRILRKTSGVQPVLQSAWDFQALDQPAGMAVAARQANAADVLVVAAWRDTRAFEKVGDWLQHWLAPRREKSGALVCLSIDRLEIQFGFVSIEERLAQIARHIGMDFFSTHISAAAAIPPHDDIALFPHELHLDPERFRPSSDPAHPHRR